MIRNFLGTISNQPAYKKQIALQKESLMTRAWILHTLKNVFMVLSTVFGTAYWEREADPECSLIDQERRESHVSILKKINISFLIMSILMDFFCWYRLKATYALLYFESIWVFIETLFVVQDAAYQTMLVICTRFIALGVFFGIDAK